MRADALITERQAAAVAAAATAAAAEPRPAQGGKGAAGAGRPRRAAILVVAAGPPGPVTGGARLSVAAGLSFVAGVLHPHSTGTLGRSKQETPGVMLRLLICCTKNIFVAVEAQVIINPESSTSCIMRCQKKKKKESSLKRIVINCIIASLTASLQPANPTTARQQLKSPAAIAMLS